MAWIALTTPDSERWALAGLDAPRRAPALVADGPDAALTRGSFVVEVEAISAQRPRTVLSYTSASASLTVQTLPGGAVSFVLDLNGEVIHHVFAAHDQHADGSWRLTYAWDTPTRAAFLALERPGRSEVDLTVFTNPQPFRLLDLQNVLCDGPDRFLAPGLSFLALSTQVEAVGPRPTLAPSTRVETPHGPRAVGLLQRGDLVRTASGDTLPVLFQIRQQVPAAGSFAPLKLRAPSFGLHRDLVMSSTQSLVFAGADVAYHLGQDKALLPARFVAEAIPVPTRPVVSYVQLVLPTHATLIAEGARVDSLYVGRLRRYLDRLSVSPLAAHDRSILPEHIALGYPVQRRYEAALFAAA